MDKKIIQRYKYLCGAIFVLVSLGGAVRAMNAGLACPDWPLCFGDIIPDFHPQVYFEFLHRALAGLVGIFTVWFNIYIIRRSEYTNKLKIAAMLALVLLFAQIIMGGLTVLLQLHEKVVALHLTMGTGFFALMLWIYLSLKYSDQKFLEAKAAKKANIFLLVAIYGQIILGGLVASHYAALVCTDFPLCHGQFIPTLQGIIGLHVIHRLGAYTLTVIVAIYAFFVFKKIKCKDTRRGAKILLGAFALQIVIGISNVLFHTPPLITVLHLAVGTLLLGLAVKQLRISTIS